MNKKWIAAALVLSLVLCLLSGCDTVGQIAGNVLEAAVEELEDQVKDTLTTYKVEVVELKTAAGKLNDEGGETQFFCAALVRTNAESSAKDCADALKKVFPEAGYQVQAAAKVESEHLVHKSVTFVHSDYSGGNYYTVYMYAGDLSKIVDLDVLAQKLKEG